MEIVLYLTSFLVQIGIVALFVRLGGRLLARTAIPWTVSLKFAAIGAVIFLLLIPVSRFLGATGLLFGLALGMAAHAVVGALYLAPRAIKQSGQSLTPITGALVGVGAAFLWFCVMALVLLFSGMFGLVRG